MKTDHDASDEPSDRVSGGDPGRTKDAVTQENLIQKLTFVAFGGSTAQQSIELRQKLVEFHTKTNPQGLTKQAIRNWFPPKESKPKENASTLFILEFLGTIEYEPLSEARKKVYKQVDALLRHSSVPSSLRKIRVTKDGELHYRPGRRFRSEYPKRNTIEGVYVTYKMRFVDDARRPIAREVLRVFYADAELRFEHWYKRQNEKVGVFEGTVLPTNDLLWFFGVAEGADDRLRIMSFRRTDEDGGEGDRYRWGIVHSDVPQHTHEPAVARILLTPVSGLSDEAFAAYVQATVIHLAESDLPEENRTHILRLVDNHLSARSIAGTALPALDRHHAPVVDAVLSVDGATMHQVIRDWVVDERPKDLP